MDRQLRAQLAQTVLISNSTGVNVDGERSYGTATSYRARVIGRQEYVRNQQGEEVTSSKQIIFESSADVRVNSRLYLPGETTSANEGWVPVAVALRVGESGSSDHWKVWLGEKG